MEVAVRETYEPLQMRTAAPTPWQIEPTSNVVQSTSPQITQLGSAGGMIGVYILLYHAQTQYCSFAFDLRERSRTCGANLIENALIRAFEVGGRTTTVPQKVCLAWQQLGAHEVRQPARRRTASGDAAARTLLVKVQSRAGLTLEEIAPLLSVSRRSLQHWRAHGPISARKEKRLRDLSDALESIPAANADEMRQMLLDRVAGDVRPYDLLAEGRFDAAYSMITHAPAPAHLIARSSKPITPSVPSLIDRLSSRDDGPPLPTGRVNLGRSRRLKR
jgi:hypothetical protein